MELTREQVQTIVERALPDARLRDVAAPQDRRYRLALADGERMCVQLFESKDAARTAAAALRLLRAEVDLPIPQLRASDPDGEMVGQPYLLLGDLAGEPLVQAIPRIDEEQLYALGRRLGEALYRVHRLACERYGALEGDDPLAAEHERDYALARLDRDLGDCAEQGLIEGHVAGALRDWFAREFSPPGRQAALICAGASPQTLLVAQRDGRWRISGLLGWERALGWCPAWEHVAFFDAADDPRLFSLRVGYGNAYDDQTQRAYEQVREHALTPYRILLNVQRMTEAHARGALAECARLREVLHVLIQSLER